MKMTTNETSTTMTETETPSTAVAVADDKPKSVADLIQAYHDDFALALPSHVDAEQWIRQGLACMRKDADLWRAANNDQYQTMRVLFEAARLGHVPGTKEFYLVPRGNKDLGYEPNPKKPGKNRAKQEITGIEGYHGIVERMYRAGAITSVVAELVHENDSFRPRPGEPPIHDANWFGERGEVIGGYAYATMREGGISRVVIMSLDEINEHRDASDSWKFESTRQYSPWAKWPKQMRLKTLARALEPWVPTSSEYLRERLRIAAEAQAEFERGERERKSAEAAEREQQPVVIEGQPLDEPVDTEADEVADA